MLSVGSVSEVVFDRDIFPMNTRYMIILNIMAVCFLSACLFIFPCINIVCELYSHGQSNIFMHPERNAAVLSSISLPLIRHHTILILSTPS